MIVQCKECGKDVSTEAVACPSCGYPQKPAVESSVGQVKKADRSHVFGWIALIAFFMSLFTPAILAPLIVLVAIVFALLELTKGGKVFGSIALFLCLLQVWAIADHFGGISASMGLTNTKQIEERAVKKYEHVNMSLPGDAHQIIQQKCAEEWPNDFRMRSYCEGQQQEALGKLSGGQPADIQADAFRIIRGKCAEEWPRDFRMRAYCEAQQSEGYRALQMSSRSEATQTRCAQKWPNDYRMRQYCERNP